MTRRVSVKLIDQFDDALLHPVKIGERLRHAEHKTVHTHWMDGHRGGRHNKAAPRRYGERYADGMAAAEHKRNGRLAHPGEQLRDCKPRLDIAADSVENDDKPFNN